MRFFLYCALFFMFISSLSAADGKHLFILSGQSNMKRLNPEDTFKPAVSKEFGANNVIVVHDAQGGESINRWYKKWQFEGFDKTKRIGQLYDRLMSNVKPAIANEKIVTVTFIWMQGERDAKMKWGDIYEESLYGLFEQLKEDLGRQDLNFVLGRLSDHDLQNKKAKHWTKVRAIQEKVADSSSRGAWIDTDDLNTGKGGKDNKLKDYKDDLHMTIEGYKIMGERFAASAIELIKKHQ